MRQPSLLSRTKFCNDRGETEDCYSCIETKCVNEREEEMEEQMQTSLLSFARTSFCSDCEGKINGRKVQA